MKNRLPAPSAASFIAPALLAGLLALAAPAPLLAQAVPAANPEDVGLSSARLARIGEAMDRHIEAGDITGAVTLVARQGRIAHFEAHGLMDLDAETPMRKDAVFRLMSMTKPVMAAAVLMLLEEGKLRLGDPVSTWLPEFAEMTVRKAAAEEGAEAGTVPAEREITIHDLLTHTSGIVRNAERTPEDTLETYVPKLAELPLEFQPGADWQYSGLAGPDVLARIVEIVSGKSFGDFLRIRIFEPLGMDDTSFRAPDAPRARLVSLYNITDEGFEKHPNPDFLSEGIYTSGGAGLVSTAEDYLQFAQLLANRGVLDGKRLLGSRTVDLMAADHVGSLFAGKLGFPARGVGFGLQVASVEDHVAAGWRIPDGSFGWLGAYGTQVWINPDEELVTLVMIQNFDPEVQRSFENAVAQAIID